MKKFLSILFIFALLGVGDLFARGGVSFSARSFSTFRAPSVSRPVTTSTSSFKPSTFSSTSSSSFRTVPQVSNPSVFSKSTTSSFRTLPSYTGTTTINHTYLSVPGYRPWLYSTPSSGFYTGLRAGALLSHYNTPYVYFPHYYGNSGYMPVITDYASDGYQEAKFTWDNGDTIVLKTYQKVDDVQRTEGGLTIILNGKPYPYLHGKQTWLFYYANQMNIKIANNVISTEYDWSGPGFLIFLTIVLLLSVIAYLAYAGYLKHEEESYSRSSPTRYKW